MFFFFSDPADISARSEFRRRRQHCASSFLPLSRRDTAAETVSLADIMLRSGSLEDSWFVIWNMLCFKSDLFRFRATGGRQREPRLLRHLHTFRNIQKLLQEPVYQLILH